LRPQILLCIAQGFMAIDAFVLLQ